MRRCAPLYTFPPKFDIHKFLIHKFLHHYVNFVMKQDIPCISRGVGPPIPKWVARWVVVAVATQANRESQIGVFTPASRPMKS